MLVRTRPDYDRVSAQKYASSLITSDYGIAALLIRRWRCFRAGFRTLLNYDLGIKANQGPALRFIRNRFLSLRWFWTGFLLLVSMALTTFLTAVAGTIGRCCHFRGVNSPLNSLFFRVVTLLFAMIFKYLPDVKIPFREGVVGAIGTALLFTIGKYLLSLYLGRPARVHLTGCRVR